MSNDIDEILYPRRARGARHPNAGIADDQVSLATANEFAKRNNVSAAESIARVQSAAGRAIRQTMVGDDPKTTKPLTPLKAQVASDAARKAAGKPAPDHKVLGGTTT